MAKTHKYSTARLVILILCSSAQGISLECRAADVEVQMLDGSLRAGTIVKWDARQLVLQRDGEQETCPAELILEVRQPEVPAANLRERAYVEFVDGSVIPLKQFTTQASQATIETPLQDSPLSVPTSAVGLVQFPSEIHPLPKWREKLNSLESTSDTIIVLKKEGTEIDILDGVVGNVTPDSLAFTWSGDTIDVKRSKLAGLTYFHASQDPRLPLALFQLADGSTLAVKKFAAVEQGIRLETNLGVKLEVQLDEISSADFSAGKLTYLSSLPARSEKWTALIELPLPKELAEEYGRVRRDESFEADPLQLAWPPEDGKYAGVQQAYRHGLAIRSRTELKYLVPDQAKTFLALAGIDPLSAQVGSVDLKILLDGEVAFDGEISGGEAPQELELNVAGKKRMSILVDYGQNQDLGDRLHLVEARFTN